MNHIGFAIPVEQDSGRYGSSSTAGGDSAGRLAAAIQHTEGPVDGHLYARIQRAKQQQQQHREAHSHQLSPTTSHSHFIYVYMFLRLVLDPY